ncbi:hypothetical protein N7448_002781 [Penicillium atrosanguineum]|uniref:Uncharacterized protein n=1 Tax=Penicillium atrosanguineum TaxID=1132637 RepID=A0A9W9U360_9EURO|nr:uncharacterized protein N7443_006186 [Penicillium atrosanguineum]KAJ5129069.1 hypothetical protein N7526_007235 [Penicillium atrosanguineum]KAJ5145389.1 hypothetical protein N7448_002781 [Penicillium atrosanguineum]KAJ5301184.1 hypothetical protein N7443_006186 [Penicillium atrosanguineum]KAJ5311827.1 hypothetical protein N7476_007687 [Penicillium atrosanguineum]
MVKQGAPWLVRKALKYANLSLEIKQASSLPDGTTAEFTVNDSGLDSPAGAVITLHIKQTVRPGSFDSMGTYHLDGKPQEFSLPIFGDVNMRLQYINVANISNETLRQRLEKANPSKIVINESADNPDKGWEAQVVWAFELVNEKRYLTRNVSTWNDKERVEARMVYDYQV